MAVNTLSHYLQYYLHESTEPMVVDRFMDELGWYAYFIGPPYSRQDTLFSLQRIWGRYFGPAKIPVKFIDAYYPSLKLIGVGASRAFPLTRESGQAVYSWGPAIYELVAIAMFRRWYYYRDGCPIPFEYPDLVDAYLPPNGSLYFPRFRKPFFIFSLRCTYSECPNSYDLHFISMFICLLYTATDRSWLGADGLVYHPAPSAVSGVSAKFKADRLPISAAAGYLPFSPSQSTLERHMFRRLAESDVSLPFTLLQLRAFVLIAKFCLFINSRNNHAVACLGLFSVQRVVSFFKKSV